MINHESLESIIRRYVLLGPRSPKGYEVLKCPVCNDYKIRGGFKFDGERIDYHCFNCGIHAVYDPSITRHSISKKMESVLTSFGIPIDEIKRSVSFNFFRNEPSKQTITTTESKLIIPTKAIDLPGKSVEITSDLSPWCVVAREYLITRRILVTSKFYVSDDPKYEARVIIPYLFRGKIIYWQGRSMDKSIDPRYINPVVEKDNIFFNMDELYRYTTDPLYVSEGVIDALSVGQQGVALVGSDLTEFKINELERVSKNRQVVFLIDKNSNGYKLGLQAIKHGWSVTVFPDNIDDANVALCRFGQIWLIQYLATSPVNGFAGEVLLKTKCK